MFVVFVFLTVMCWKFVPKKGLWSLDDAVFSYRQILLLVERVGEKIVHLMTEAWNLVHGSNIPWEKYLAIGPSQICSLASMAAIFQNGRPKVRFSNISASSSLRIVILVSKHTYLGARIPIESIANTYLHDIGSHFPKWPTKKDFPISHLLIHLE